MAAYITVGAKTSHGGTVITGSPHTTHNGIPVSRKGDKVICKKCKKLTTIFTGDPSFIVDGAPIARAGDVTSCGAKLIAVQQSFCESDFEVMGVEQPAALVFPKSDPEAVFGNCFVKDDKEEPEENADTYVITNLGEEIDGIAADSLMLQENIKGLQEAGWDIKYGPAEEGTYTDYYNAQIVISEEFKDSPTKVMHALTHEVGHATYQGKIDTFSKQAYVNSKLKGEGGASTYSIMIRQELLENGGVDIMEDHTDSKELEAFVSAYETYGDTDEAWEEIGEYYRGFDASTTGENYEDFYGRRYDEKNF